ncbi:MAG: hypothetical protein LBE85_01810 [Candidatus Accumulibacter sp.]|jgi:hypothetical protein|nr:hypothetical protein [Accumulibacter sp.]
MTQLIDLKVPDIGDFQDVPVIDGALATRFHAHLARLPGDFRRVTL